MLVLRATRKVLRALPQVAALSEVSDTALGDWYVNRVVIDRRPLLLLVSEKSRLSILEPARDVKRLPLYLSAIVSRRLVALAIPDLQIAEETKAMTPVTVGPTKDKSIVGQLVDFAKAIPYYLPEGDWGEADLRTTEDKLGETPCLCSAKVSRTIWPIQETRKLLAARWS